MEPNFDASKKQYKILKGNDDKNWVSTPCGNNKFEWKLITDISSIPIKLKYNYQDFLDYYKNLKIDGVIFHYNDGLLNRDLDTRMEEELERKDNYYEDDEEDYIDDSGEDDDDLNNSDEIELDSQDIYLYQDDGYFGRYEVDEYAEQFGDKKVIILTDIQLLFASVTDGKVYLYDYNIDDLDETFKQCTRYSFKDFPIVKLQKISEINSANKIKTCYKKNKYTKSKTY